jgi:hypothetical protein
MPYRHRRFRKRRMKTDKLMNPPVKAALDIGQAE